MQFSDTVHACYMQKGCLEQLTDGKLCCEVPGCEGRMKLLSVDHRHTVGIYHYCCSATLNKSVNQRHTKKWHSQYTYDEDYACNRLAVSAEFLSGGSWTQLNQRHDLLGLARFPESYYEDEKKRVAAICEEHGRLEVERQWQAFKALAVELRIVGFDMRHASSRGSKHSTFEVLRHDNHKAIFVMNIDTDEVTGNAWRNEDVTTKMFFQKCLDEGVEISAVCHDQCTHSSSIITWFNEEMAKKVKDYEPMIDANDMWHGKKSFTKHLKKMVHEFSHVFMQNKDEKEKKDETDEKKDAKIADKKISSNNKKIAEAQLTRAIPRIGQLFMQVCNANKGQPKHAIEMMQATAQRCLIHDEHSHCQLLAGPHCACVLDKRMRELQQVLEDPAKLEAQQTATSFAEHAEHNSYLLDDAIARAAALHGISLDDGSCSRNKKDKPAAKKRKKKTIIVEPAEGAAAKGGEKIDHEDEDVVFCGVFCGDELQPLDSQITHPIAIACLKEILKSTRLKSLLTSHCHCLNTSYVECLHNVETIYAPKRKHFRKTYSPRIYLGILDWNENIDRETITTDKGNKCKPPKTFKFQHSISDRVHGPQFWL